MSNKADTCRTYIVPKLHASGWGDDFITEQMVLTHGRIVPIGDRHIRRERLQVKVNVFPLAALGDDVRELQVKGGEELSVLMPSVLDRAFRGKL